MTSRELEKILNGISLSSLSDREIDKLYRVVKSFYKQLKVVRDYREYCKSKK